MTPCEGSDGYGIVYDGRRLANIVAYLLATSTDGGNSLGQMIVTYGWAPGNVSSTDGTCGRLNGVVGGVRRARVRKNEDTAIGRRVER